jgi:hypothetical protein
MCANPTPGYEKGSYEGGYCPCYAWDMVGRTTTGEYISPVYYYPKEWGKDNWGKKLREKIQVNKVTPPPNCQPLLCNPLRLIINDPHSITTEPSVLRHCRLGASLIGPTDPIGSFLLELLPTIIATPHALFPTLLPQLCHNQTGITVVEVKDQRQTVAIETGYKETSFWLEWIKCSVHTLNNINCYACVTGRPEPQVVSIPLAWTTDLAGMACMIALFQERTAWGDWSCRNLSLLFLVIND